jgi:hypothetical protein
LPAGSMLLLVAEGESRDIVSAHMSVYHDYSYCRKRQLASVNGTGMLIAKGDDDKGASRKGARIQDENPSVATCSSHD